MYHNTSPTALYQEYEARVAEAVRQRKLASEARSPASRAHPLEENVTLDFTDYNQQRYAAISTARARRQAPPQPRRPKWGIFQQWVTTLRAWLL